MKATYALLAALAAHEATATWNMLAKPLTSPNYNDNECSDKQKAGFDWSDLKDGDSNFQYGDFDFSKGWKCSSAPGKRDHLSKRTFGGKTIQNSCSKQKPASFGCDKRKNGFSITTIDVSVEFDVEVDLHYTMEDGSLCKQKSVPCKQAGNTIQNTQCGGAKTVDVYLGSSYSGSKSDCQIGFHHIGFDCNPGKTYTPPAPPVYTPQPPPSKPSKPPVASSPPPAKSTPVKPPPAPPASSAGCNGNYGPGCPQPPAPPVATPPVATPPVATPPVASPPVHTFSSVGPFVNSSAPPTYQTNIPPPAPPAQNTPPAAPPCNEGYGGSCGASSAVPSPQTSVVVPPSQGPTPPAQPSSPVYPPSQPSPPAGPSSQASPPASPPSQSSPPSGTYSQASPPVGPPSQSSTPVTPPPKGDVPPQLPQCMNTWLQVESDCKDNTAVDCYCKNSKFTKNVIDCVQAWCETDEQTKQALQYLVGICSQYVPQNPGLVSDCPKDTFTPATPPKGPAPPAGGAGSSAAPVATPPSYPVTTIVMGSTSVEVPQVHFTTQPPVAGATPTAPIEVIAGPPSAAPAVTTGGAPYPVPSTLRATSVRPTGTGAVRPSGSSPAQFTGAASPFRVDVAMLGAAIALAAF